MIIPRGDQMLDIEGLLKSREKEFAPVVRFLALLDLGFDTEAVKHLHEMKGQDIIRLLRISRRASMLIGGP